MYAFRKMSFSDTELVDLRSFVGNAAGSLPVCIVHLAGRSPSVMGGYQDRSSLSLLSC